jgi:uncharacterized damage-inducible protein DinB
MFTSMEHVKSVFSSEINFTEKVFDNLTDKSMSQAINKDHRTLARMAWHIIASITETMGYCGLEINGITEKDPIPATAAEIKKAYRFAAHTMLDKISSEWSDETLQQEDDLYGETWKRGLTLLILLKHEIHHRGQITVLMRQAGLVVPSIYGPAKEGWADHGVPVPEV